MSKETKPSILKVLWLIRDAQSTKGAARHLLNALALRCRPDQRYVSWPSYAVLAADTQLNEATLQRAAKKLDEAKLIKRIIRVNRSNRFFINVLLLQEQAEAAAAAKAKAAEPTDDDECPFNEPSTATVDSDVEELDSESWNVGGAQ